MAKTAILATARTPFGKMGGAFKSVDATELGGTAIAARSSGPRWHPSRCRAS